MTAEESLAATLTAASSVLALVGERVYPRRLPTGTTLPALSYFRVTGARIYSHRGPSGLDAAGFQVTCWDATYGGAKTLAQEVRPVLEAAGYRLQAEIDLEEPEPQAYTTVLDFQRGERE